MPSLESQRGILLGLLIFHQAPSMFSIIRMPSGQPCLAKRARVLVKTLSYWYLVEGESLPGAPAAGCPKPRLAARLLAAQALGETPRSCRLTLVV